MIKISQGAEAVIYQDAATIIKERLRKAYRIPQLDNSLRQFRTRREAKILQKLEDLHFPAPHLKDFSDKRMSLVMDFIPGEKLKDVLGVEDNHDLLAKEIGTKVGLLHAQNIIHGDLTTSNMIWDGKRLWVLEIETLPSMLADSAFAQMTQAAGVSFPDLLSHLIQSASPKLA
mgnify:CR=1 FL=1